MRPDPVFAEPWHAEAFAIAVHLEAAGAFEWGEWARVFGAVLAEQGTARDLDGGDDYFLAWIEALERICLARGLADAETLSALRTAWRTAYSVTPHGAPVTLADPHSSTSSIST